MRHGYCFCMAIFIIEKVETAKNILDKKASIIATLAL